MVIKHERTFPGLIFVLAIFPLPVFALGLLIADAASHPRASFQSTDIPNDVTRVYYKNAQDRFVPLPFEPGITSVNPFVVAPRDKLSYAKLKGSKAVTVLSAGNPSFYVFVADRWDPPPHQLVQLKSNNGTRRFTVISTKGRKGYSPLENESIRLEYRLLERLPVEIGKGRSLFLNYMEIHPNRQLAPGEYAIIGDSLLDIATFRIQ
jgi:hypothetical protein